ncbi:MAG: hypothetical protein IJ177_03555 [Fibrobacter sp.]|uniref:hypothetical protein n=1 Tax=Fibrobacter sp. TaxID=35828 RepID=UPI0025C2401E|nr:hypothetical protein [Fibrobacter sp.]MBQ9225250.1 hypothetical protein [Fibrobacter sp.]
MDVFGGRFLFRNSEMDAYGVRGFGSVMSASKLAVATLALHAFAKTFTSFRSAVVELTS